MHVGVHLHIAHFYFHVCIYLHITYLGVSVTGCVGGCAVLTFSATVKWGQMCNWPVFACILIQKFLKFCIFLWLNKEIIPSAITLHSQLEFTNYHGTLWNTLFGKLVTCHLCIENKMFGSKANATSSLEMWFGILIFYLHDQNLFVYRLLSELKLEVKTTQNLKFVFCPPLEPMPPGEPVTGNTYDHIYFSDSPGLSQSNAAEST